MRTVLACREQRAATRRRAQLDELGRLPALNRRGATGARRASAGTADRTEGTVVQYAGRLHGAHPGKRQALVYDYIDAELPGAAMHVRQALKAYRAPGYELAAAA